MAQDYTNDDERIAQIASHYEAILRLLGEEPSREGLVKTPVRAAKALWYSTRGYRQDVDSVVHEALFEAPGSGMITVKDIEFYSLCEHHVLPFFGHISVGYIPNGKIIGISKLARLVDMFARRLQVQERIGEELVDCLARVLSTNDVIARCEARHMCMMMRGVEKQDSATVTLACRGRFQTNPETLQQFFDAIR